MALVALAAGCARSYDGTVVPTYQMAFSKDAALPLPVVERTPLEPASRDMEFPPPPKLQAAAPGPASAPRSVNSGRRGVAVAGAPIAVPALPVPVRCPLPSENENGRASLECVPG